MALTKRRVDSFNYDGRGRDIRWDGEGGLPGFGLRIYPSGKKVFVLVYRRPGQRKQRLKTIGSYGVLTLDGARQRARKLLVEIGDGADPTSTAPNQTQTLKDFTAIYLRDHAKPFKKSWKEDERRINKHVVPELGSMLLIDTRRSDLVRLHQKIGKKAPYEANQILALIGSIFAKAEEWGYVPEGHPNPSRGVQKSSGSSRLWGRSRTRSCGPLYWFIYSRGSGKGSFCRSGGPTSTLSAANSIFPIRSLVAHIPCPCRPQPSLC